MSFMQEGCGLKVNFVNDCTLAPVNLDFMLCRLLTSSSCRRLRLTRYSSNPEKADYSTSAMERNPAYSREAAALGKLAAAFSFPFSFHAEIFFARQDELT